jgi:hypothetical protein
VHALDALVIRLYVRIDDFLLALPPRTSTGRRPQIGDSELITLAVAQMFLGIPDDRRFLAVAGLPARSSVSVSAPAARLQQAPARARAPDRAGAPRIAQVITHLAAGSASFGDGLRLLDSTPVPCGQSRETALRSELAGSAAYGYCRSHSRYLWGFPLYLLREVAAEFARTRRA